MKFIIDVDVTPCEERDIREVIIETKEWLRKGLDEAIRSLIKNDYIDDGGVDIYLTEYMLGVRR
jgi:hypothetical protein